jgi:hypothetical protein
VSVLASPPDTSVPDTTSTTVADTTTTVVGGVDGLSRSDIDALTYITAGGAFLMVALLVAIFVRLGS